MITYRDDGGPESIDFDSNLLEIPPHHSPNPNPWRRVSRGRRHVNPILREHRSRLVLHPAWTFATACGMALVAWSMGMGRMVVGALAVIVRQG